MPQGQTLAQRVKAKYPGQYDDLSDADLETKVKTKYPGVYDDIPLTTGKAAPAESSSWADWLPSPTGIVKGVAKGVANTVVGLGQAAYEHVPGVAMASDGLQKAIFGDVQPAGALFDQARKDVQPQTGSERIGFTGEQIGEFFVPAGAAGKVGKAAEIGKAALLGKAQSGSDVDAGISGGLTAVAGPAAGLASRGVNALKSGAEKSMVRAMAPTKEWAKAQANKIAPEMVDRGVKAWSRPGLLAQATRETEAAGVKIGAAIKDAAAQGKTVPGQDVLGAIATARASVSTVNPHTGELIVIPGTEGVVKKLEQMESFITSLGPDIPIDQAAHIKTTWDQIVNKAGLYGQNATASASDKAKAWATREAASSMRKIIATGNPDIAALNKEYAFWSGIKNVVGETEKRTQAHGGGLTSAVLGSTGAAAGFASGESWSDSFGKAAIGGIAGRQLVKVLQSPAWATRVSAPMKANLAHALASGSNPQIVSAVRRIVSSLPAQMRPVEAQ